MRLATLILSAGFILLVVQLPAQESGTIIAPASGGVEIEDIVIVRRTSLGAVKSADLTNMRIDLRLLAAWEKQESDSFDHLVRLHSLSPIEDDSGKRLLTEKRVKGIYYLEDEVRGRQWWQERDKRAGTSISLLLDAPARSAVTIKAIQGRAEVLRAKEIRLKFDDLSAIDGKELNHPDLPELEKLKLQFSIETMGDEVTAKVSAPFNYASPWFQGRLSEWSLMDGAAHPRLTRESKSPKNGGVTVERTYRRQSIEGLSLRLIVLSPFDSKTFDFEFRDVELP